MILSHSSLLICLDRANTNVNISQFTDEYPVYQISDIRTYNTLYYPRQKYIICKVVFHCVSWHAAIVCW